jgi:hypothetical protein
VPKIGLPASPPLAGRCGPAPLPRALARGAQINLFISPGGTGLRGPGSRPGFRRRPRCRFRSVRHPPFRATLSKNFLAASGSGAVPRRPSLAARTSPFRSPADLRGGTGKIAKRPAPRQHFLGKFSGFFSRRTQDAGFQPVSERDFFARGAAAAAETAPAAAPADTADARRGVPAGRGGRRGFCGANFRKFALLLDVSAAGSSSTGRSSIHPAIGQHPDSVSSGQRRLCGGLWTDSQRRTKQEK